MNQIHLSEGTSMALTENMVQLIKRKGPNFRVTFVPRHIVELSLRYGSAFDRLTGKEGEEVFLAGRDEWLLSVTTLHHRKYMGYTRMDKEGNRIR